LFVVGWGTGNREQGTGNREQGTGNRKGCWGAGVFFFASAPEAPRSVSEAEPPPLCTPASLHPTPYTLHPLFKYQSIFSGTGS